MTTIGRSVIVAGEVSSDEDLVIEGRVHGEIRVREGTLTIAEHASIEADMWGSRIVVRGRVRGALSATERIEVAASAIVKGSLSANRVVLAEGAVFNGRIDMDQRTIAARVAQFKATQGAR